MAEYIKRENVLKILSEKNAPWNGYVKCKELPAEDVQPVKWIPVTEELPAFEGSCLCMIKDGDGTRAQDRLFFCDGVFTYNGIYPIYGTVTHWMPLPEPPKEDKND